MNHDNNDKDICEISNILRIHVDKAVIKKDAEIKILKDQLHITRMELAECKINLQKANALNELHNVKKSDNITTTLQSELSHLAVFDSNSTTDILYKKVESQNKIQYRDAANKISEIITDEIVKYKENKSYAIELARLDFIKYKNVYEAMCKDYTHLISQPDTSLSEINDSDVKKDIIIVHLYKKYNSLVLGTYEKDKLIAAKVADYYVKTARPLCNF